MRMQSNEKIPVKKLDIEQEIANINLMLKDIDMNIRYKYTVASKSNFIEAI